jgi:hypothetical protein
LFYWYWFSQRSLCSRRNLPFSAGKPHRWPPSGSPATPILFWEKLRKVVRLVKPGRILGGKWYFSDFPENGFDLARLPALAARPGAV